MVQGRLITVAEAAGLLNVSAATVRNWIRNGSLAPAGRGRIDVRQVHDLKSRLASGQVDRLRRRANKSGLRRTAVPAEYAGGVEQRRRIEALRDVCAAGRLDPERALFVLAARLLVLKQEVGLRKTADFFNDRSFTNWRRDGVRTAMLDWRRDLAARPPDHSADYAGLFYNLEAAGPEDLLGGLYQAMLFEGRRSGQGFYLTPGDLVAGVFTAGRPGQGRFLDPCCGTGQFLMQAARNGGYSPAALFGLDQDRIAVRIARINLLLSFPEEDFSPGVFQGDFLDPVRSPLPGRGFRLIATNPPWGAALRPEQQRRLQQAYPFIRSRESFAYFLAAGLSLLESGGRLSFFLPESFLNIRVHGDIRAHLLSAARLTGVTFFGRRFEGVQSPVIRIDVTKHAPGKSARTRVVPENKPAYRVPQARFSENDDAIINALVTEPEAAVIKRIYDAAHVTLAGTADWALGIVTGDNRRFVSKTRRPGMEPVFRGQDVEKYRLKPPAVFIRFEPERFQQTALENKYRAREKLIYRFVSRRLVFAYDDSGALTLNSANIVIPRVENYPIKAILGVLNSRVIQFVFSKRFQTHKVLRRDLESLPLPLPGAERLRALVSLVDRALAGQDVDEEIDDLLMTWLALTPAQRRIVSG